MLVRLIAAKWAVARGLSPEIIEGDLTDEEILEKNTEGYNCFSWPNGPSPEAYARIPLNPHTGQKMWLKGSDVDNFDWIFVDLDMKDYMSADLSRRHEYASKEEFVAKLFEDKEHLPTKIVDTGNGIHAYWRVVDMDAKSFLRLTRRIAKFFKTDPSTTTLNQLMRIPNTLNVKDPDNFKLAELIWNEPEISYDAETLNNWLPPITPEDEAYCVRHYDQAHNVGTAKVSIADLPSKFLQLCKHDREVRQLFKGPNEDRSIADFRLGRELFNNGFSKEEALAVLCHTAKASERSQVHQFNYANNIVEKIYDSIAEEPSTTQTPSRKASTLEGAKAAEADELPVEFMADIEDGDAEGERIYCHEMIDATASGFRLTQVMGLIGGSGNGKTTTALNLFRWFAERNSNKDYIHLFVSLEMPKREIKARWKRMAAELKKDRPDIDWDRLVCVLDNYDKNGKFRQLGLDDIESYVHRLEKQTGKKVGCLVVDHIGVLRQKKNTKDEMDGLIGICKQLKSVAVSTKTFFIIQSQTSRAKNGGGDIELDMDAAFGTSNFEFFCDYIMTTWQPLKRVYSRMEQDNMLCVTAFKMAKIRHKRILEDRIKPDTVYGMVFDPRTELMRPMTSDEMKKYEFYNKQATTLRTRDKKRQPSEMVSIGWIKPKDPDTVQESDE